ncbi:MAG: HAD-IB family phosphatase [Candidatus Thalassarchaeaceae archaeon]|nr:HAD-IB family phosphatase [Candidatus Thalassarchaeaceae archaeon]
MLEAVVFDCDGVLADNGSSWQIIHQRFGTENDKALSGNITLDLFLDGKISEADFVEDDIRRWRAVQPKIHRDDIVRCYSGFSLMDGARDVIEELQSRGVLVAIISSGVDLFVGAIAGMLKVDDWAANGFEWDDEGWLVKGLPTRVFSHNKGLMVEKLVEINGFAPAGVVCVGDSSTDLSMQIEGSRFIGFNPARQRAIGAFESAGVPIVAKKNLKEIWPHLYPGEGFPGSSERD